MKQVSKKRAQRPKRQQPRKDSGEKRVNYDNTRDDKFRKDIMSTDDGTNDVRWYAQNTELLIAAASVSFYLTTGMKVPFFDSTGKNLGNSIPGIITINWSPYVGGSENAPLRQAANQVYSFTVHANSRNYAYNPSDQMLLIISGAQVFAAIALGIRAYGVMQNYNGQDYYTPEALVTAMGFKYSDLRNNLSQMWFDLNQLIAKSRQIWIPNTMPLIERWFWMSSNIYRDGQSAKAQYYMYVPANFLQYDETTEQTGGSLQSVAWYAEGAHTWEQYMTKVNGMIDALLNSEDRGIIFGDLLKAYGADKIYTLSEIASDYKVTPVYNMEVLSQIENTTITGQYPGPVVQTQDDRMLKQDFNSYAATVITENRFVLPDKGLLNFHQLQNPTPEQVMVATRMMSLGTIARYVTPAGDDEVTYAAVPFTAGTEIAFAANIYYWNWSSLNEKVLTARLITPKQMSGLNSSFYFLYNAFDWAPHVVIPNTDKVGNTVQEGQVVSTTLNGVVADYDNYTFITQEELQKMHTAAIYSLFGVPQM